MEIDQAYAPVAGPSTTIGADDATTSRARRGPGRPSLELKASTSAPGKAPPKIKVKLGGADSAVSATWPSASGSSFNANKHYDRDLDSDPDEPLVFEEHFILKVEDQDLANKLQKMVAARDVGSSTNKAQEPWFQFKDPRRATFGLGGSAGKPNPGDKTWNAKLVDLPCIVESHKTLDNKRLYKTADICQMLLVESQTGNNQSATEGDKFDIEDYIYPHGITPPLKHVRKRRFRKRANKRVSHPGGMQYLSTDNIPDHRKHRKRCRSIVCQRPDFRESYLRQVLFALLAISRLTPGAELIDPKDEIVEGATPAPGMTPGADGAPTPGGETEGSQRGNSDDDEDGEGIDDDLAAELERGLEAVDQTDSESEKGGDSDSDMGGLFGSNGGGSDVEDELPGGGEGGDEEVSTEQLEARRKARLLGDEIRDLEGAVNRKRTEVANASNPIIKVGKICCLSSLFADMALQRRFEDSLRKLTTELDLKKAQLASALSEPDPDPEGAEEEDEPAVADGPQDMEEDVVDVVAPERMSPQVTAADQGDDISL